jgi:Concanavalin A-like lectin/glucanases superfamily
MKRLLLAFTLLQIGLVNAQIENGMIANFPFNNNITDISTSGIIATNNGGVFGLGRNGGANNAIEFNGSEYVSFNDNAVKVQFPVTISAWVNFNNTGLFNIIYASDNVFGDYFGYYMGVSSSGQVTVGMHGGLGMQTAANRRQFITANAPQAGIWHNIVGIIRDYDDMTIYIDCVQEPGVYAGSGSTTVAYSSGQSRIGSINGSPALPIGSYYDGSIDQLVIWDREVTPAEITYLCDINNPLATEEQMQTPKKLLKIVDMMGRETPYVPNTVLIYVYDDGSTERKFMMED